MKNVMLAACMLMFTVALSPEPRRVRIGVNNAPPYRIVEGTRFYGIYIDIINEAFARLGIRPEYEEIPLARLWGDIKSGRIDMMLGPNINPERAEYMFFLSHAPLPGERKVFYTLKARIDSYNDIYRYTIGCLRGNTYNARFDADGRIRKFLINDVGAGMEMVSLGRLDAIILPERQGEYLVRKRNMRLVGSSFGFEGKPSYIAISKKSPLASRRGDIERTLRQMMECGDIDRIISQYK